VGRSVSSRSCCSGAARAAPPPRRRSKEEFLDAVAALLERKGDYADAYRTFRDAVLRDLEHELGLPAGADPGEVVREAGRRKPALRDALPRLLEPGAPAAAAGFVRALNELESLRDGFCNRRHDR
jgi:hypothetical protein